MRYLVQNLPWKDGTAPGLTVELDERSGAVQDGLRMNRLALAPAVKAAPEPEPAAPVAVVEPGPETVTPEPVAQEPEPTAKPEPPAAKPARRRSR